MATSTTPSRWSRSAPPATSPRTCIPPTGRSSRTRGPGWACRGGPPLFGLSALPAAEPADVRPLADGDTLELAGLRLGVRHAPGHTEGSVVFSLDAPGEPVLFSGDLLFAGSIGRVDLPGGSEAAMLDSLARVVLPLDDATVVHPGHGPSTSIGRERATNPFLHLVARPPSTRKESLT